MTYGGGGMPLHQAARWSPKRRNLYGLATDSSEGVNAYSRTQLMQIGRWLYANDSTTRAGINEQATFATAGTMRKYKGSNKTFGGLASEYLSEQDKSPDIRGGLFNLESLVRSYFISVATDGDMFPAMMRDEAGNGRLQSFRAHRVAGDDPKANITNGVGVDRLGRATRYRVTKDKSTFEDIPAGAFIPLSLPDYCDQLRGISMLATPANAAQDIADSEAWEMLAQKAAAKTAIIEENETGSPFGIGKQLMDGGTTAAGNKMVFEELANEIRYFRAGSGSKLTAFTADRPTANQAAFVARIRRSIFASMMWPYEFYDLTLCGGAAMRVAMEKINATILYIRQNIVFPLYYKFDLFRIACAIDLGILPPDPEWHKWAHIGAADLTSDAAYDSNVAINEIRFGLSSMQIECARRGLDWQATVIDNIEYKKFLDEESAKRGVDSNTVVFKLPNGNPPITQEPAQQQNQIIQQENQQKQ